MRIQVRAHQISTGNVITNKQRARKNVWKTISNKYIMFKRYICTKKIKINTC